MLRLGRLAAVAGLLAWLGLVAAAHASDLVRVGTSSSRVVTDGKRYAAFTDTDGRTEVFDDQRGTWTTLETPSSCEGWSPPTPLVGSGYLLWTTPACDNPNVDWNITVRDLATGTTTSRRMTPPQLYAGAAPVAIGANWIRVIAYAYHYYVVGYANWHTGAGYFTGQLLGGTSLRRWPDLDAEQPFRRLCAGMHRSEDPNPEPVPTPILDFTYDAPYGLAFADEYREGDAFAIYQCGRKRPLRRCRSKCEHVQLGAGLLSWHSRLSNAVRVYDPKRHRAYSWTGPGDVESVGHTASRLFVLAHDRASGENVVYAATIPH